MKYGVAVILYNPDESSIKRIETYSDNFFEVIIIDNSDEDNIDIESSLSKYKNCIYHRMNGNEGMAKALNYALYKAIEKQYDIILTMDQDSIYTKENIINMKAYIDKNFDQKIGIYSANYSKMYYDNIKNKFIMSKPMIKKNKFKDVDFAMTSGSFVNVQALEKVLPIDDYFIGYVDNYLSAELKINGYKILRIGASFFAQQVGGTVYNSFYNRLFRILHHKEVRYYYMTRNNLYLQKKFKNNIKFRIKNSIGLLRIIANIIIGECNKKSKLKACLSGYRDYKRKVKGKIPDSSIIW